MAPPSWVALVACAVAGAVAVTIDVSGSGGIPASPLQYGIMFEDINHSGDGGL
jgi:alpha-N-arabinofuranosidase